MSKAKEIQEKLDLQARIQLSLFNQSSRVTSWIQPNEGEKIPNENDELKHSQTDFFQLPVIQVGSGLNMDEGQDSTASHTDIHTIGEFIKSDKKVSSLAKKRQYKQSNGTQQQNSYVRNNIHRIAKDDTKAMVALKRKMRKDITAKQKSNHTSPTPVATSSNSSDDDDDDDDRYSKHKQTKKKTMGLLFQSKKSKNKK